MGFCSSVGDSVIRPSPLSSSRNVTVSLSGSKKETVDRAAGKGTPSPLSWPVEETWLTLLSE